MVCLHFRRRWCHVGDYRVSKDGVGVVVHSSPFEWYETLNCKGKRCEDMLASEITGTCKMALTNYHFQKVLDLLAWADGKVIIMLCIKNSNDLAHAIQTIITAGAQDRAFLEVGVSDMINVIPKIPEWQQVFYMVDARSQDDLNAMLDKATVANLLPNLFTFEFEPHLYKQFAAKDVKGVVDKLHAVGLRTLTATTRLLPSVASQEAIFNAGIDVVYSYDCANAVEARNNIDKQRGLSIPSIP